MAPTEEFSSRLARCDLELFAAVPAETTEQDRRALLALHAAVRAAGDYAYLEIGSHLGGSLQAHCADPRCRRIYSIDKRPAQQPDIRGIAYRYDGNSSARMLAGLRAVFGDRVDRIVTFDCDAAEVPPGAIADRPRLCFIDGEHTTAAVRRDFAFCRSVVAADGIIAFHDAQLLHAGIAACRAQLVREGVSFRAMKLPGAVYALLLGEAVTRDGPRLAAVAEDERWFRLTAWVRFIGHVGIGWRWALAAKLRARWHRWRQRR